MGTGEEGRQRDVAEGGLFGAASEGGAGGETGAMVSAVRELAGTPKRVSVIVGRKRVAVLLVPQAMELGLAAGVVWTDEVAARAGHCERVNAAKAMAMRRLAARARSRAEMLAWLGEKGFDAGVASEAVERLAEVGLIRDEDVAAEEARRGAAKGLSGRAIGERLAARGVDGSGDGSAQMSDRERALDVARGIVGAELSRRAAGSVDVNVLARRTFGALSRKGYEEEGAREAVERALGERGLRVEPRDV